MPNQILESTNTHTAETVRQSGSRISLALLLVAVSMPPIFIALIATMECQQRHYVASNWGGIVVLSSIFIYSFGKLPRMTSAEIARLQFGSRIEGFCYLVCRKFFDRPLFLHDSA
jgi:hypothetical protein